MGLLAFNLADLLANIDITTLYRKMVFFPETLTKGLSTGIDS
jgi:hypothetical protein